MIQKEREIKQVFGQVESGDFTYKLEYYLEKDCKIRFICNIYKNDEYIGMVSKDPDYTQISFQQDRDLLLHLEVLGNIQEEMEQEKSLLLSVEENH